MDAITPKGAVQADEHSHVVRPAGEADLYSLQERKLEAKRSATSDVLGKVHPDSNSL